MSTVVNTGTYVPESLCRIPPGALVVEMKYCELCGRSFPRAFAPTEVFEVRNTRYWCCAGYSDERPVELRRDKGQRLCSECVYRPSPELSAEQLLKAQERYKAQLPGTENQMRHATHLPKYDRPPVGRETSAHRTSQRPHSNAGKPRAQMLLEADKWRATVRAAFREKGKLSAEELQALIPRCFALSDAQQRCRMSGVEIKLVARMRRKGIRGPGIGVYVLPGVSPETVQ